MDNISLKKEEILEYIQTNINDLKIKSIEVSNAKYHHNTSYLDAPLILKYGILPLIELNRLNIRNYSEDFLNLMNDTESHINGNNAISLAVVGLDDIYPKEDVFNPLSSNNVDFIITSDIRTYRTTTHYGNEFLHFGNITIDKLRAIDIRMLELINNIKKNSTVENIKELITKYNALKHIALSIKQSNLEIPFRDMSNENLTLDIDKVINNKKLILKDE